MTRPHRLPRILLGQSYPPSDRGIVLNVQSNPLVPKASTQQTERRDDRLNSSTGSTSAVKGKDTSMCTSSHHSCSIKQEPRQNGSVSITCTSSLQQDPLQEHTIVSTSHIRRKHAPPQSLAKTLFSHSKHLSIRHMLTSVTCYLVATSEATRQGPQKSSLVEAPHSMTSGQHGFAASRRRPPQHLAPSASQRLRDPRHSGWTPRPRVWHSS